MLFLMKIINQKRKYFKKYNKMLVNKEKENKWQLNKKYNN